MKMILAGSLFDSKHAQEAIDNAFEPDSESNEGTIYNLPVTKAWIEQLVLALMLLGHTSYRNIILFMKDLLDVIYRSPIV